MYSAFRKIFLLLLLCYATAGMAQETGDGVEEENPAYYYDVLGKLRVGLVFPSAFGTNFLAENYDINTGFYIDAAVRIDKKRDLGIQLQGIQGTVTSTENLGLIESSTITYGFIVLGQSLLSRNSHFEINADLGIGYVNFRNRVDFRRFNDSGVALLLGAEAAYRINKTLGVYFSIQNQWGFLQIDAPSSQQKFLRNTMVLAPSVGIKFYIL